MADSGLQTAEASVAGDLLARFREVRALSERLCAPLSPEDATAQSMPDCSPAKWHLAHTTWFFETFLLKNFNPAHKDINPAYAFLFNSYYNAAGPQAPRPQRGLMTRPSLAEAYEYRRIVDEQIAELVAAKPASPELEKILELGINHEQQHQELILTDIKHLLSLNPLRPAYTGAAGSLPAYSPEGTAANSTATGSADEQTLSGPAARSSQWIPYPGGLHEFGHAGSGFHYDNEAPRHRQFLEPFELAARRVTNGEYLQFIADGGYARPELWLSMGWATVQEQCWTAPLYWSGRQHFTLRGMQALEADAPVCHVSYFEADAYARWAGARLPTEFEWELAARDVPVAGNFVESGVLEPVGTQLAASANNGSSTTDAASCVPTDLFGNTWEWTRSQYNPYPGYAPAEGALGEYNGKFMCNQFVLRGGSCATSVKHIRPTYRNFFPPEARWQFSGVRLARDVR